MSDVDQHLVGDLERRLVDVVVVGDGPAGAALARSCVVAGCDTVLVGPGTAWSNTYGVWADDVVGLDGFEEPAPFESRRDRVLAVGERRHVFHRSYAVIDNGVLRSRLLADVRHVCGVASRTWTVRDEQRVEVRTAAGPTSVLRARHVVDASGAGGAFGPPTRRGPGPAWQTAYGVVLAELPAAVGTPDAVTFMDFSPLDGVPAADDPGDELPSFCYVVPVRDGWLVEETVLAASPPVDPVRLRSRLERRLGGDGAALVASSTRTELVRFPMGGPLPTRSTSPVRFGAAASYVHPATGFSVTAALRAAPRVARAIAAGGDVAAVNDAVWSAASRRTRALHEYGADVLLTARPDELRRFFDVFFDLEVSAWADYLRIDVDPTRLASIMSQVFRRAPWSIRRRLVRGDPRRLVSPWRP